MTTTVKITIAVSSIAAASLIGFLVYKKFNETNNEDSEELPKQQHGNIAKPTIRPISPAPRPEQLGPRQNTSIRSETEIQSGTGRGNTTAGRGFDGNSWENSYQ